MKSTHKNLVKTTIEYLFDIWKNRSLELGMKVIKPIKLFVILALGFNKLYCVDASKFQNYYPTSPFFQVSFVFVCPFNSALL